METKDKMIEILNKTFDDITSMVEVDYKQSSLMKNPKHIELVERYAKVLTQHYVGKFAHLTTSVLTMDTSDKELQDKVMGKFENRMQEIVDGFPKDMDATLKSVKKYFGHAYSIECITNTTKECFLDDLNTEKQTFLAWTQNLDMASGLDNANTSEKVTA